MTRLAPPERAQRGLVLVVASLALVMAGSPGPAVSAAEPVKPNIILITTDDMNDYEAAWMPNVQKLIGDEGTRFTDFISQHPLCCPARAEILTGQYAHNNGVRNNGEGPELIDPDNNIGSWLQAAGYKTAFVGKFLNYFGTSRDIAGWDHLNRSVGRSTYKPYDFRFEEDGFVSGRYIADHAGRKTVQYVREFSATDQPFMIWTSHVAPHRMIHSDGDIGQPIPATRHADMFPHALPPSLDKPSFNEDNVQDKPEYLRKTRLVGRQYVINSFRARIRSLQAVDEQVGRLVNALAQEGELDNTVFLFTSDNGYLLGEHRILGKNKPFEEALQVDMLARGPGFPVGRVSETVTTVDIAATIAYLGGAVPRRVQDGTSFLPMATGSPGYEHVLVQAHLKGVGWLFRGVRTDEWVYLDHFGTQRDQLYNRVSDPYQLRNQEGRHPAVEAELAALLDTLRNCAGAECYSGIAR